MERRTNPCYRCENRSTTCRLDCPQWTEYVKERDAAYEQAAKIREIETGYADYRANLHERIERRKKSSKH